MVPNGPEAEMPGYPRLLGLRDVKPARSVVFEA